MAIPASGAISIGGTISTEYGNPPTPDSLSEFYRDGANVPNHGNTTPIPLSLGIALSDFYSTSRLPPDFVRTITIGNIITNPGTPKEPDDRARGYADGAGPHTVGNYGSIAGGNTFVDAANNPRTLTSQGRQTPDSRIWLSMNGTSIPNVEDTFRQHTFDDAVTPRTFTRAGATYAASIDGGTHWRQFFIPAPPVMPPSGTHVIRIEW